MRLGPVCCNGLAMSEVSRVIVPIVAHLPRSDLRHGSRKTANSLSNTVCCSLDARPCFGSRAVYEALCGPKVSHVCFGSANPTISLRRRPGYNPHPVLTHATGSQQHHCDAPCLLDGYGQSLPPLPPCLSVDQHQPQDQTDRLFDGAVPG